jgi:hypothetical protein
MQNANFLGYKEGRLPAPSHKRDQIAPPAPELFYSSRMTWRALYKTPPYGLRANGPLMTGGCEGAGRGPESGFRKWGSAAAMLPREWWDCARSHHRLCVQVNAQRSIAVSGLILLGALREGEQSAKT